MKVRDSGMPEEAAWELLFDAELVLDRLGIDQQIRDAAELGCGYGTFTLPVAQRIGGTLYAFDIDQAMVTRVVQRSSAAGLTNVVAAQRDVLAEGFGLSQDSLDGCLLFNILHHEDPVGMLRSAAGAVRPGGRLYIIHWRHDGATPRGPDLSIRPRPEQVIGWAEATGILESAGGVVDLPPWHYGLVLHRTA
jgi:SAM-dependent methyltransferase